MSILPAALAGRSLVAITALGALVISAFGAPAIDGAEATTEPPPSPADVQFPFVLTPGVTDAGTAPQTWDLDVRGLGNEEAQAVADGVSSRVYGPRSPDLHEPLVISTDFEQDTVLGIYVEAVCLCGAEFDISVDGEFFHRLEWEPQSSTIRPETIYHLPVPAGERTVTLTSASGAPVVIEDHTFVTDVGQFPADRERQALEQEEPPPPPPERNQPWDGYRGIWFELGQVTEWGDKYSGGLGTYTMHHSPLAVYAPEVGKTFFTYGGTTQEDERQLLIMAGEYDHRRHQLSRPVVVDTKAGVNDPHDNASIALDDGGHVWLFVSGRSTGRPGFKYRSLEPYSTAEFELVSTEEMTYPQPRHIEGQGFYNGFTKYTAGRELYWETSPDGREWSPDQKLAGFGGHYQVSEESNGTIVLAFNYHPDGVDTRTNVYVTMTDDLGQTWTTVDGTPLQTPLADRDNPALVADYEAEGLLSYVNDLGFDADGNPVVLHLTSGDYRPGPNGDPRTWRILRWTGQEWENHEITTSDHNYDAGSLYIEDDRWSVYLPTEPGPQEYQTGGEMVIWDSVDEGQTWEPRVQVTRDSASNQSYARRALGGLDTESFYAFWADGDPTQFDRSTLHMGDAQGRHWEFPYTMTGDRATPRLQCLQADPSRIVKVAGLPTGVKNKAAWDGCSVQDVLEGDRDWEEDRFFVAHVERTTRELVSAGTLTSKERAIIVLFATLFGSG